LHVLLGAPSLHKTKHYHFIRMAVLFKQGPECGQGFLYI